jgi:putative flavoprotein involved in K+ transport
VVSVDTVVIGAGHAGLAVSRLLTARGHEHVVLDRGRLAERWRSERWDSLHLLSPNWTARLPGWCYTGQDPDGFMSTAELVGHLEEYAASFAAPVQSLTTVEAVSASSVGYRVTTERGVVRAAHVVVATGAAGTPHVPPPLQGAGGRRRAPRGIDVITSNAYRNPDQLPAGAVLVVGASSSGVQIADELSRWGRDVVLAVGGHSRMPRRYRGMDCYWWMERTGRWATSIDQVRDVAAARREPSLQLAGPRSDGRYVGDLDLATLQSRGVRLVGRLADLDRRGVARFRDDLAATVGEADRGMTRFLDSVDRYVEGSGLTGEVWPAQRPAPVAVPDRVATRLHLAAEGITSIVLATGFRPHHPWLRLPVIDTDGSIRQHRGVTPAPGLYVVGQRFQHRRDSATIGGARYDARSVVEHLLSRCTEPCCGVGGAR